MEMITEEFLKLVTELNQTANVVLEFGLQTIHRKEEVHIQRPNNRRKIERVLAETYAKGISTEVSLIFGLPEQTVDSFRETINFCKHFKVPVILAYPLRSHRGTPLYDNKNTLQLVESTAVEMNLGSDHIGHVISSPSFSKEDWEKMAEMARELDNYNAVHGQNNTTRKMANTLNHTLLAHLQHPVCSLFQNRLCFNLHQRHDYRKKRIKKMRGQIHHYGRLNFN